MDEIMELLTEEIDGFNRSVERLEELSKNIESIKVKADSTKIEYYIEDFLERQKRAMVFYKERAEETKRTIKSATLIPKWLMALCCITLSITFLTLCYFGYHFIQVDKNKKETFMQGREEAISELKDYFGDHPIIYRDFQRWSKKQDSVADKK